MWLSTANCTVHALLMEVFAFLPFFFSPPQKKKKKAPQSPNWYCVGAGSQAMSSKQELPYHSSSDGCVRRIVASIHLVKLLRSVIDVSMSWLKLILPVNLIEKKKNAGLLLVNLEILKESWDFASVAAVKDIIVSREFSIQGNAKPHLAKITNESLRRREWVHETE